MVIEIERSVFSPENDLKLCISCVLAISITQLHSTKPELRFCAGSNRGVSEFGGGEKL